MREGVKNVCFCPRLGYKNCPRRGRGVRKCAKFCPRSCWMPPSSKQRAWQGGGSDDRGIGRPSSTRLGIVKKRTKSGVMSWPFSWACLGSWNHINFEFTWWIQLNDHCNHWSVNCYAEKACRHQKLESFTTSKNDRHLLSQKVHQKISVIITNTCVLVVFKTKRELKCQNELFF